LTRRQHAKCHNPTRPVLSKLHFFCGGAEESPSQPHFATGFGGVGPQAIDGTRRGRCVAPGGEDRPRVDPRDVTARVRCAAPWTSGALAPPNYAVSRCRSLTTDVACHAPPRGVRMARRFSSSAMHRTLVIPALRTAPMDPRTMPARVVTRCRRSESYSVPQQPWSLLRSNDKICRKRRFPDDRMSKAALL
jgi:hypothetical protein